MPRFGLSRDRLAVVTGAAGFIGGRIANQLHEEGFPVLRVDLPGKGLMSHRALLRKLTTESFRAEVSTIIHQGAVADTQCNNHTLLWELNYEYSRQLYDLSRLGKIPLLYASSAAVYGACTDSAEGARNEKPLNAYAQSKLAFDNYVRSNGLEGVVGLRYFNVYGPGESHKGSMASVAYQAYQGVSEKWIFRIIRRQRRVLSR